MRTIAVARAPSSGDPHRDDAPPVAVIRVYYRQQASICHAGRSDSPLNVVVAAAESLDNPAAKDADGIGEAEAADLPRPLILGVVPFEFHEPRCL
jgi:hypothetical protein